MILIFNNSWVVGKFEISLADSISVKKPKFRRFGIGTGTKVQQANLRTLAKDMAEDPGILIPDCIGKCSRCQFEKLRAKLRKIQSFRDNPAALKKLASGGKQLERAYAAMLLLATEDTPIMFATAKLPNGDVSYTVRGKAKKEFLIGLQHFDDPKLRLLAYSEFAVKKKLHLYSLADSLSCSGKSPNYPPELVSEVLRTSSYALKKTQGGYTCEHGDKGYGLRLEILSAGMNIEICKSCASRKQNLFTELTSRVLARHPDDDFRINLEHDLECIRGDGCTVARTGIKTSELLVGYRAGKLSDEELIEQFEAKVRDFLVQAGKTIFVLGNTCYEDDFEAFIKVLEPSEIEEIALKRMLKTAPSPVVMDTATPNAVLALFWDTLGPTAIYSVIGDKELAKKIYSEMQRFKARARMCWPHCRISRDFRKSGNMWMNLLGPTKQWARKKSLSI
jgi:hypothetical protein